MRRTTAACALLLVAAAARAGDLDDAAKKRVGGLVHDLTNPSEMTRDRAVDALAAMGIDALPTAVLETGRLGADDAAWASLLRAVEKMGEQAPRVVLELKPQWPAGAEFRLERLAHDVRARRDAAVFAAVAPSPRDVVEKIDGLVSDLMAGERLDYGDPKIAAIAALGRPALGELVRILRDFYGEEGFRAHAVAKLALQRIAVPDDVPLVAAIVREGRPDAAVALRDVHAPEVSEVLADAVRRGPDGDLCFVIERRGRDETVGRELAAFVAHADVQQARLVGIASLALGRAGAPDAAAAIRSFVAKTDDRPARVRCFVGLARSGAVDGIEGVLAALESPDSPESAHVAGVALNETSGRGLYKGKFDPETKQFVGNFAEAGKAYRAWWSASKDKAKFDETKRKWTF